MAQVDGNHGTAFQISIRKRPKNYEKNILLFISGLRISLAFAERRNFSKLRGYLALKLGRLTPAMIVAWSEIGVMFIDEFGMVKAELYDLTS